MKFFAVHLEDLESEKFLSASNDQIATWLFLHALCCKLCNGGTISDARSLTEKFWSRHGISKLTIEQPSPLWSWNGDDLTVKPYDIEGQYLFEKKSGGGKTGSDKRWNRSPKGSPKGSPNGSPNKSPNGSPIGSPNGSPNKSPNGSPNAPDPTRPDPIRPDPIQPDPTQPDPTQPDKTSSDDEGRSLFNLEASDAPSKKGHELFEYWNTIQELPRIKSISPDRRKQLGARLKDEFFSTNWKTAINQIPKFPFLVGGNDRGWKADIDWFLKPGSVAKILEGKYITKPPTVPQIKSSSVNTDLRPSNEETIES